MRNLTHKQRSLLVTFLGAGLGALFADHLLKPKLKGKFKV